MKAKVEDGDGVLGVEAVEAMENEVCGDLADSDGE